MLIAFSQPPVHLSYLVVGPLISITVSVCHTVPYICICTCARVLCVSKLEMLIIIMVHVHVAFVKRDGWLLLVVDYGWRSLDLRKGTVSFQNSIVMSSQA